jgi:dipeptidyl aminopeptidase/acylaminoacyl peptidase
MKQFVELLPFIFLAACTAAPASATLPPQVVTVVSPAVTPTNTPRPTAILTMEDIIQPYTIDGLREHDFQGGEVTIIRTMLETDLFTRYLIEYPSDGLIISGVLQVPKNGTPPFPVIVMNHGFFSRYVYNSGDGTDRAAEFLNRRGYLTISSDYRTWGDSDTEVSLFYSGLAIDVINLMNALPSIPEADAERIGMWGHSMGGGVTLKVLTIDPRVKAAVLYSSVSADFADIIDRWGPGCNGDVYVAETTFGCNSSDVLPRGVSQDLVDAYFEAVEDPEILEAVSPYYHLDLVTAPVQITYGSEDGESSNGTPPEWSKKMYQAFIDAEKEARLFGHEGESHSLLATEWWSFMERSAQFFDQYVRP